MQRFRRFLLSFFTTLLLLGTLWSAVVIRNACESRIHGVADSFRLDLPTGDARAYLQVGDAVYRMDFSGWRKVKDWLAAHPYLLPEPVQMLRDLSRLS